MSVHYTLWKTGQIEAFNDLRHRGDVRMLVIDRTDKYAWFPLYYLNMHEGQCYWISNDEDWKQIESAALKEETRPNYAFVNVPQDISMHIQKFQQHGYKAEILERYGPAPLEWLLAKANPRFNSTNEVWLLKLTPLNLQ